ncbi:splicing factor, Prp19-binding domain-containing protein [Gongronella butleri]|nr:splicing factor, Prp19-binding domain-containing protein [Gongronella butleri]
MSHRPPQNQQRRPTAQAKRYRAGAPKDYVSDSSSSDEDEAPIQQQKQQTVSQQRSGGSGAVQFAEKDVTTGIQQQTVSEHVMATDRRMQRLQLAQQRAKQQQRGRAAGRNDDESSSSSDNEETDEQQARDRLRMKQRALQRAQEEQQRQDEPLEEESEEESSSEYDTESDSDEQDTLRSMPKPMFIPRNHRATVLQQEQQRIEEEEREKKLQEEAEERRIQSHKLLEEELKKEHAKPIDEDVQEDVDDTDGLDEQAEFEAWKVRELMRIKRDREQRISREKEQDELEQRRLMPEDERLKQDMKRAEASRDKEKGEFTFMQKYYHKGAFFQDMAEKDGVFKRDYSAPTVNEVRKRDMLPEIMQVKNFGLAGRTKYTHLKDQDTTDTSSPWAQQPPAKRQRHHGESSSSADRRENRRE